MLTAFPEKLYDKSVLIVRLFKSTLGCTLGLLKHYNFRIPPPPALSPRLIFMLLTPFPPLPPKQTHTHTHISHDLQAMMQEMQRNPEMMRQMMAGMGGAGGGGAAGGGALGGMQNMFAQNPEMLAQMMQV